MTYSLFEMPRRVEQAVEHAARAEAAGLHRYWVAQVETADPMVTLAVVADRVPRIRLGVGVAAMQSTLPQHLAQQARTLAQISGDRFTLGLGASHEPIATSVLGLSWQRPYSHMVQYLDALLPLLSEQTVAVDGDLVSHRTAIDVPGPTPDVVLAALGPRMLRLAARRTAGTILGWTGPRTIEQHVRPTMGPDAEVVATVSVCVTDDADGARERVGRSLALYRNLPSYQEMVRREGLTDMMDLLVVGSPDEVRGELARYHAAGADEVALMLEGTEDEVAAAWTMIEEGIG